MTPATILHSAEDVTPDILKDAEEVLDGWYADAGRIDWEEFIDRLADHYGSHCEFPYDIESYDSPAVRKIQAHIRKVRADG